jgi:hypothetical protein
MAADRTPQVRHDMMGGLRSPPREAAAPQSLRPGGLIKQDIYRCGHLDCTPVVGHGGLIKQDIYR